MTTTARPEGAAVAPTPATTVRPDRREAPVEPSLPLLLDATKAARTLGINRRTLFRWDVERLVPAAREINGRRYWSADELREWVAAKCPPRHEWERRRR